MHSQITSEAISATTMIIKLERNFHVYWNLIMQTVKMT